MNFTLLETAQMRSALQVLWHNATPEVKAAFLADDDSPEKLIEMIDSKIDAYADEIRKALADRKGDLNMIKMGTQFWDESNSRFLTVDAVGADPNCYCCIQEEIEDGSELVMTGRVWMYRGELEKMEEV